MPAFWPIFRGTGFLFTRRRVGQCAARPAPPLCNSGPSGRFQSLFIAARPTDLHPPSASPPARPAAAALLTEAVRLIEDAGPLEDSQALRQAAAAGGSRQAQAGRRAGLLAERLDLRGRLARAQRAAPWVLLGLAAAVVLAGLALAGGVVDAQDRRINVMAALVALLGTHLVTLALWLLALAWPGASAFGGSLIGRLWLTLTARFTLGRGTEGAALLHGGLRLLERARLLPWLLGLASHVVWTLAFAAALGALLFALSFRRYTLGWETTLLDPAVFARWVQALAVAPGWLGFPVPDAAAPTDRQLAGWLVGCVIVYGLLPRALCALLCAAMWRARRGRLAPDWREPYYQRLFARFDALAPAEVVDADTHGGDPRPAHPSHAVAPSDAVLLAGFELPADWPWPPAPLPPAVTETLRVDGSAAQRLALLQALERLHPRLLVLACRAAASPDRGTERLLREALPLAGACRLWLLGAPDTPDDAPAGADRWQRWLASIGLDDIPCATQAADALLPPAAP